MTSRATRSARPAAALVLAAALFAVALAGCTSAPASGGTGTPGTTASNVQQFNVDLSSGTYVPSQITAKAGIPVQITFGQGRGCVQTLVFPSFNIKADMAQGPKTFDLGALQPGKYAWSCGMNMQHGVLTVR